MTIHAYIRVSSVAQNEVCRIATMKELGVADEK